MVYCAGKLIQNWNIFPFTQSYFIIAIDFTFYGITGVITHAGCWENTRKACKSLAKDGNDVTCHAWFSEKLCMKPEINVIVKKKNRPQFPTLYTLVDQRNDGIKCSKLCLDQPLSCGSCFHLNLVSCEVPRKIRRDMLRYFHLRRVIYKLFLCSSNVPRGLSRR